MLSPVSADERNSNEDYTEPKSSSENLRPWWWSDEDGKMTYGDKDKISRVDWKTVARKRAALNELIRVICGTGALASDVGMLFRIKTDANPLITTGYGAIPMVAGQVVNSSTEKIFDKHIYYVPILSIVEPGLSHARDHGERTSLA